MLKINFLLMYKWVKKPKPILNSLRHVCLINKDFLWKGKCIKKLSFIIKKNNFKNQNGHIIFRRRNLRLKKRFRKLDNEKNFFGVPGTILRLEYDPYRTSFIALILYKNGLLCYITSISGLKEGSTLGSYLRRVDSFTFFFKIGDTLPLKLIEDGTIISNIESKIGFGSAYSRASGTFCKLIRKSEKKAFIKVPTKKLLTFPLLCRASLGANSNSSNKAIILGKAGRSKWRGYKSIVRGVARNPVDHPHGGGEGKKSKKKDPMTFWGKVFKWRKTSTHKVRLIRDSSI